jgi:hypothetical protein
MGSNMTFFALYKWSQLYIISSRQKCLKYAVITTEWYSMMKPGITNQPFKLGTASTNNVGAKSF